MESVTDSQELYLVTGAAGYLGNTLVKMLVSQGKRVRCLVLPGDEAKAELPPQAEIFTGDILCPESIAPCFQHRADEPLYVIHCAGMVSIATQFDQRVYDLNVTATDHILELCRTYQVTRLIYVSSVHAIAEPPKGHLIRETKTFDPALVTGCYAKAKAETTRNVMAAADQGLPAVVVHPSGICGPYDYGRGNLTQLLIDYCKGHLTAGVDGGGYDFVDVRDVAQGIIAACHKGRLGETYILSNQYYPVRQLLELFHQITGLKPIRSYLPLWFAKVTAPLSEVYYKVLRRPPLYTPYSLYTLTANSRFSHEKADRELDYTCRPMEKTIREEYLWLRGKRRI